MGRRSTRTELSGPSQATAARGAPASGFTTSREALDRRFRIFLFDWDGTAVVDRSEDATAIRAVLERAMRAGVLVVVVTGTNVRNVHAQLSAPIRGPHAERLYLATNRGSEVYRISARGEPVLMWARRATPDEDRRLTEIADALRDALSPGLEAHVVYDRMNRRKIDLIPIDRWRDPPKAKIAELLAAVDARLSAARISGGLREVIELGHELSRAHGLPDARITTDAKHIEIGLTDKSDSIRWTMRELAIPSGIRPSEILIAGDEFGPIGGVIGSDAQLLVPEARGAAVVSVGVEPAGVAPGVLHLGGGPARFRALLSAICARFPVELPASITSDDAWRIVERGFVIAREHEIESLFAIGNGFLGARASLAEGSPLSAPATFVSGIYDAPPGSVPSLVALGDWTRVGMSIDGEPFRLERGEILEHRRTLDMAQGILWREWLHRDPEGRVTHIAGFRLASRANRRLLLQVVTVRPENYAGSIAAEATIESALVAPTSRGESVALVEALELESPHAFARLALPSASERVPVRFALDVDIGRTYRLDRAIAVATSREADDPLAAAQREGELALEHGSGALLDAHRSAWRALWEAADVRIEGDPDAQRAIRFSIYHLLAAASPEDEKSSIGARALTGRAYAGHVFWDTEIYMLPFYTHVWPEAARALLSYRWHTLPAARAKAARLGHAGALFAWESADTGDEVAPRLVLAPDGEVVELHVAEQEQHISADVAYAVHRYVRATGDETFMLDRGAEILIETARFWASRAALGDDGAYHIASVIGPDEYHESVDDDAYTNGMAAHNLEIAAETARDLEARHADRWRELATRLHVRADEPARWVSIAARMYDGLDARTGIIEQFRGYHALEEIELSAFEPRTAAMDVLLPRARLHGSKIIKQPDVLMLIYLLWDRFPPKVREACFDYYDPRTGHGSSLSPSIHALYAARLGRVELAMRYFRQAAEIDLANNMGNASGGVHVGAAGGLWQAIVFGFAGLHERGSSPALSPVLPPHWRKLTFATKHRGRTVRHELGARARPAQEARR